MSMGAEVVVLCAYCGENEARYICERGELCCGLCPIKRSLDSIRIVDVPGLLAWARVVISYGKNTNAHVPAFAGIKERLGRHPRGEDLPVYGGVCGDYTAPRADEKAQSYDTRCRNCRLPKFDHKSAHERFR